LAGGTGRLDTGLPGGERHDESHHGAVEPRADHAGRHAGGPVGGHIPDDGRGVGHDRAVRPLWTELERVVPTLRIGVPQTIGIPAFDFQSQPR
jgi:hypothetical protein